MNNANIKQAQNANLSRIKAGTKGRTREQQRSYRVFRKIVLFHSSLQLLTRLHIAVRDRQSSQRSASVQSLL